ncbi:ribosomal protein L35, putative [Plasmodium berghei]|uniref:50S ribosomal protein L35 n=2 Tax=Plasmodium berghei TaxID=5821 RepID=A0A509AGN5_PLABA|nr:ribosomal protein L35, apicoplast, putative [Plasmodium berghei ANKA]CXI30692.1 ribosomal protein L35, putative [Plasmodium berghei]SCM20892.1 ribosomal protein L35, putative [Plasmodium berghei]SCN24370.1 ribosomal protein L35, putative [Plasmodium berghei]SCO59544.1 ribosomal protein L35, putative [Plasmodium berghei]SCO60761.1 ribosomal protein L35, putative [Plasmodium berghei]|eukprot:XP_034421063.1 ribosomal protein L35, apicoplast, putative [Plasmodium berghei ANKA]
MKFWFYNIIFLVFMLKFSKCLAWFNDKNKSRLCLTTLYKNNILIKKKKIFFFNISPHSSLQLKKYEFVHKNMHVNSKNMLNKNNLLKNISFLNFKKCTYKNWDTNFFVLFVRGCTNVKPKTNKSIAKRFKITKNGKLIRKKCGGSHMLRKRTSSNRTALRKKTVIASNKIVKKYKSVIFK